MKISFVVVSLLVQNPSATLAALGGRGAGSNEELTPGLKKTVSRVLTTPLANNENANAANPTGAAVRAYAIEDVVGPLIASILSGDQSALSSTTSESYSEASVIFQIMAELIQSGIACNDMESEMLLKGYTTENVQAVLLSDPDVNKQVQELMMGCAQKELIDALSNKDEDEVKLNSMIVDTSGNSAKGPDDPVAIQSVNVDQNNDLDKPPVVREADDNNQTFGGSSQGPMSGMEKPVPDNDDNDNNDRRLIVVPVGCEVNYPSYIGDGYCDKSGGYNTAECGWDGGDCCDFTCAPGGAWTCGHNGYDCKSCSPPFPDYIGDGYCDGGEAYNNAGCGFDAGDCCEHTCSSTEDFLCGVNSYNCKCQTTQIQTASFPSPGREGPGFRIRNDTPWPVEITLWQNDPIYWELVKPGQYFYRETGNVKFTVKATINMDNQPKIDFWDNSWPITTIVAAIALAMNGMGPSASFSASVAAGGAAGSVDGTVVSAVASTLVGMGLNEHSALFVTADSSTATRTAVTSILRVLAVKEAVYADLGSITRNYMQVSYADVYAGWEYPHKQETQTMRVHGGPIIEPASIGNHQCVNVFDGARSRNLQLSCLSGACYLNF